MLRFMISRLMFPLGLYALIHQIKVCGGEKIDEQHRMSDFINYMDYFITTMVLDKEYGVGSNMVMCGYIWIDHILCKKEKQIISSLSESYRTKIQKSFNKTEI